ncbi:MAG TPA: hypothetical protein VNV17_06460, partial [Solirubrobacteraceae bacterium]|nr:hypothetical protein [Solirubrobacteraceae bacterium]
MLRRRAAEGSPIRRRETAAVAIAAACWAICAVVVAVSPPDRVNSLTVILGVAAVGAGILVAGERGGLAISASFIVTVLGAALLGPASAAAYAIIAELSATVAMRTRWRTVVFTNLPPAILAAVTSAVIIRAISPHPTDDASFYSSVALAGFTVLILSFVVFSTLRRLVFRSAEQFGIGTLVTFLPSGALSILVAVAGIGIKFKVGNAGIAFALAGVVAFSYMTYLLERSRQRAQQYVSLSWGVLAGLMRSLDIRDQRAARHSAAVARFA